MMVPYLDGPDASMRLPYLTTPSTPPPALFIKLPCLDVPNEKAFVYPAQEPRVACAVRPLGACATRRPGQVVYRLPSMTASTSLKARHMRLFSILILWQLP